MAIKTIFVAASGGSATAGSIELACQLVQRFRAHIEGYHVLLDPQAALAAMGEEAGLGLTGTLIESIEAVARVRAEETHCHAKGLITALCRQKLGERPEHYVLTAVGFRTTLGNWPIKGWSQHWFGKGSTAPCVDECCKSAGQLPLPSPGSIYSHIRNAPSNRKQTSDHEQGSANRGYGDTEDPIAVQ